MTDSSTGGYVVPSSPQLPVAAAIEDAAFDTFLQNMIVGITGLPGSLVWPSWQVVIPNRPAVTVNWASFVVEDSDTDGFLYEAHDPVLPVNGFPPPTTPAPPTPQNGYDITIEHEVMPVLCMFYGPNARSYAKLLRTGLQVAQNREQMQLNGMGLVSVGKIQTVPSIINNLSYYRCDMPIRIRREIVRNYPILDLLNVDVAVNSSTGNTSAAVTAAL